MSEFEPSRHPFLYRALKKSIWAKQTTLAFKLKEGEGGLSVILAAFCSRQVCAAGLNSCKGELVLETLQILDVGFSIVPDDENAPEYNPNHAEIRGLPPFGGDDKAIEDTASLLSDIVTAVKPRPS